MKSSTDDETEMRQKPVVLQPEIELSAKSQPLDMAQAVRKVLY